MSKLTALCLVICVAFSIHIQGSEKKTANRVEPTVTVSPNPLVTSFNGGLILSRVCLESVTSLSPYADPQADNYADRKAALAGLVVFHLANKDSKDNLLKSGMFVWDGEQWQQVSFEYGNKKK